MMNARELPKYRCIKEVNALKIAKVEREADGGATLRFNLARYAPIKTSPAYVAKHDPQAGGYFVVYRDGYQSRSPADAFESGYVTKEQW